MTTASKSRVAYLAHWQGGADTGPFHKIVSHVQNWSALGLDVRLFVTTAPSSAQDWQSAIPNAVVRSSESLPQKARTRSRLVRDVIAWQPDVAYIRHGLWYPGFDRLARRVPVVVEVGANDRAEMRTKSVLKSGYHYLTRSRVLRGCAGIVFVTKELAESEAFAGFGKPYVVISNGIDLAQYDVLPPASGTQPRLVFLGHPHSPWHGVDELPALATAFPDWDIDVIGPHATEIGLVPANLHVHPLMSRTEYRHHLAAADVAIGTLGLYHLGTNEASPLKTREYLACGLPVVIGYRDTDFSSAVPFLLEVDNQAGSVARNVDRIAAFVHEWKGRRVRRDQIANLDARAKEHQRVVFLQRLAKRSQ
jgi:glycosyltransferase involved in cell wall biosynthesis